MGVPVLHQGNKYKPRRIVYGTLAADFSGTPLTGAAPLAVRFTDQSTGSVTAWLWDFGDGSTSRQDSPTHLYAAAGTYTVTLTVSNALGASTKTRSNYVTVS